MATTMGPLSNAKTPKKGRVETWEALEKTMSRLEFTVTSLNNGNFDDILLLNLTVLANSLPNYAPMIEEAYQVPLDRAFKIFRDACRDERLSPLCRVNLMALIERRAMHWQKTDAYENYYKNKIQSPEAESPPVRVDQFQGAHSALPAMLLATVPLLGPGEQIKSSGRFPQPTRIPGKNYFKDEVVINNSDSGKVMGIKGRRVHMIEELSETIISFQRVTPGVKERLVQITGPNETRITEAIHLMGDTIRRNASPVPFRVDQPDLGSSSSVNSSASEESNRIQTGHPQSNHRLQHSFSTNDASPEYKHTVTVGPHTIKLTGTNYDLVSESKIILERHFGDRNTNNRLDDVFFHDDQFIQAEDSNKVYPYEVKQTVVRQPLFPEAPKAAFEQVEASGRPADLSARNRRAFFGLTNTEKEKTSPAPKKYLRYSRDMIYALASSKISAVEPDNWEMACPSTLIKVYPSYAHLAPWGRPHLQDNFEEYQKTLKQTTSNYNLPKAPSSSPKALRRVSFDFQSRLEGNLDTYDGFLGRRHSINPLESIILDKISRSVTPSFDSRPFTPELEPDLACSSTSPVPVTTISFRPNFKFTKKASLPDMASDSTASPVPFNRSQSTPGPVAVSPDTVDEPGESANPKQTKSFRPHLTNPRLGYLLSTNLNTPLP